MSLIPKKGNVYVVDDDEAVRDSLQWLLEGKDYRRSAFIRVLRDILERRDVPRGLGDRAEDSHDVWSPKEPADLERSKDAVE